MYEITPRHKVKARKEHRCSWCDKLISPGEIYEVSTLKVDYVYEWRECDRCREYVKEIFEDPYWGDYDPEYGIDAQTFMDFMYDRHSDVAREWWSDDE